MEKSDNTSKSINIRWFFLRLALVLFDIFAVNFSYFIALVIRFYVNHAFNEMAVRYIPAGGSFCCGSC